MEYLIDIDEQQNSRAFGRVECSLWDYFEQVPERVLNGAWDCSMTIEWSAERHRGEWRVVLERYSLHGNGVEQSPSPRLPFASPSDMLAQIQRRLKEKSMP